RPTSVAHDDRDVAVAHPGLFQRTLNVLLDEVRVTREVGEPEFAGRESEHGAGSAAGVELLGQELDAAGGQNGRLYRVERRRVATFLDMAEDLVAGVEQVAPFLLEQGGDELGGVDGV